MRILIVTGIFPPDHGGPASYVPVMAGALQEKGHEIVSVVTLSDDVGSAAAAYGFEVVRIRRNQPKLKRTLETIRTVRRLSATADVVYLNGLVLEGIIAAKLLRSKPAVIKVVGDLIWEKARNARAFAGRLDDFQRVRLPARWRALRRLQAWYTAKADFVITPSRYLADIVTCWGVPPTKIRVIYNAAHGQAIPAEADEPVDMVTVVRLVPWKGVAPLIDLAKRTGWSLKVVGDGPLRSELERQARQAPAGARIIFTGHLPRSRIAGAIKSGTVFVLNSEYEGLPHVVLEAMALGVPVVATSAGGTPELIRDGTDGFLVGVADTEALRRALERLLTDPGLRERFGEEGRRKVEASFSFQTMADSTEVTLREAAA